MITFSLLDSLFDVGCCFFFSSVILCFFVSRFWYAPASSLIFVFWFDSCFKITSLCFYSHLIVPYAFLLASFVILHIIFHFLVQNEVYPHVVSLSSSFCCFILLFWVDHWTEFVLCFCFHFTVWFRVCHNSSMSNSGYIVIDLVSHRILPLPPSFVTYSRYGAVHVVLWHFLTFNSALEMIRFSFLHVSRNLCSDLFFIPLAVLSMFSLKSSSQDPAFAMKSPASMMKSLFGVLLIISSMISYNCYLTCGSSSEFSNVWTYIDISLSLWLLNCISAVHVMSIILWSFHLRSFLMSIPVLCVALEPGLLVVKNIKLLTVLIVCSSLLCFSKTARLSSLYFSASWTSISFSRYSTISHTFNTLKMSLFVFFFFSMRLSNKIKVFDDFFKVNSWNAFES